MHQPPPLSETYEQMIREQEPNFLRLYLNPHVAQTCFCLDRYVRTTWTKTPSSAGDTDGRGEDCQSFLANGLDEAISGAIKLARYNRRSTGAGCTALVLDSVDRLMDFASTQLASGASVRFLPGIRVIGKNELSREPGAFWPENAAKNGQAEYGAMGLSPLVFVAGANELFEKHAQTIRQLVQRHAPVVITCVDRESLAVLRTGSSSILREIVPDIIVFDESFVDHAVPWSAFSARKSLFACWNRPGKATFHSTTFQPNTISTLHFMRSLVKADPDLYVRHRALFQWSLTDISLQGDWFRRHYNPSLYRLIRATGFYASGVRAAGSFAVVNGRPIFDAVSGVACSFRGHNPVSYADEMKTLEAASLEGDTVHTSRSADAESACEGELRQRLQNLTGLEFFVPALSGATAVENGLKLGLVAQFPRSHILALKAGFGGKTLLALAGTANPAYKERLDPLYPDVHYVDPFAPDAESQIESVLEKHPVAVVQMELIQAVGGLRRVPENVIRQLDSGRSRWGYLLLVDEVQTGVYRTGPFTMSQSIGLLPDFLLLGKATTDMMFPCALTLFSSKVRAMLDRHGSDLAGSIKKRYGYEHAYRTVVNVLRLGEKMNMSRRVADSSALFAELLEAGLASSKIVREVRVFGLLIGIELDTRRWPQRWLHKRLSSFYLFSMLRHEHFPFLAGFCQYEANVLKITPPLNASLNEIRQACATIVDVLNRPLRMVLAAGLGGLIKSSSVGRRKYEHANDSSLEPAAHRL
jgi:acetylornithine/succinyldiaminopimelate/putrescine aminotransferase